MGSTGAMFKVTDFKAGNRVSEQVYSPKLGFGSFYETSTTRELVKNTSKISSNCCFKMPTSTSNGQQSSFERQTTVHFGNSNENDRNFGTKVPLDDDGTSSIASDSSRLKLILQPPQDSEDILVTRKKMFSSSSFYEEPHHIYPTMEEQVDLCRKIADSLSADTNKLSRGQSMYNKRKLRSDKWVFEGPEPECETNSTSDQNGKHAPNQNGVSSHTETTRSSRKLKLVLDPRQIQDAMKLRNSGLYNEHNVVSPEICFDLVKDLNSPTGKGAALFAKRKKKSEKWIVDENTVKQHEQQTETEIIRSDHHNPHHPPSTDISDHLQSHPRLKLIKSPWEAALESPIGCCDAAFQEVRSGYGAVGNDLAETVLKRADEYLNNSNLLGDKSSSMWSSTSSSTMTDSVTTHYPYARPNSNLELYKPRAPRGWSGGRTFENAPSSNLGQEATSSPSPNLPLPDLYITPSSLSSAFDPSTWKPSSSSMHRKSWSLDQFTNFNSTPRLWTTAKETNMPVKFCPVRPPSIIID